MTESNYGLPEPNEAGKLILTAPEMKTLALRWARLPEEQQQELLDKMSRAQQRRLERTIEKHADERKTFEGKLTTREDVVRILAMYIDRNLLPAQMIVDQRLRELEAYVAYRELPLWRRAVNRLLLLLERLGITIMVEDSPNGGTEDGRDHADGHALGEGREGDGAEARPAEVGADGPGLPIDAADQRGALGEAADDTVGGAAQPSIIEVVRR